MKVKDKVIVVTGGGGGMGREMVLELLRRGARVAIADVNENALQETISLSGADAHALASCKLDIADREAVFALPQWVINHFGQVDGIINNAGIIQPFIPIRDLDENTIVRIMNINFYGTLYMVKAFLPHLLSRPEAHILNVSSMGGFIPFPGQTLYSASKAAVKLLTEGLNSELRNTSVHVTLAMPGAVNTNIMTNSGVDKMPGQKAGQEQKILQADKAARIMINAMEKNKPRVLVGNDARFLDILYRLAPTAASRFIAKMMEKM